MTIQKFSILIPTRDRPDTLRYTLQTVTSQPGDDYEVVVADNASGPEVRRIVDEALSFNPRIRYLRSESILPMSENWERGLRACSGTYVTVLGDDDGLMPDAMAKVRSIIEKTGTKLLAWALHTYWWPDTIIPWYANRLMITFSQNALTPISSKMRLKAFFDGTVGFGVLPMIYCAFFHRDVITAAMGQRGRFFWPAELPTDIVSGIHGLLATDEFILSNNPLAIRGNSKKSTGTAHWARVYGEERRKEYLIEEKRSWEDLSHPQLIPSSNLQIVVASTKLRMKDALFPDRSDLVVDMRTVVRNILAELNEDPEAYEINLRDAMKLADKHAIVIRPETIPPKRAKSRAEMQGPFGEGRAIQGVCANCDMLGVTNIAEAARLAGALTL